MWSGVRTSKDGSLRMAVREQDDGQYTVIWTAGNLVQHDSMPGLLVEAIQRAVEWRTK